MENNAVSDIKSRLNVVDFVGEYVRLTKAGSNFKGLCPFHNEKSPSLFVSEERQSWHCFGCQKGGDVFSFLMEIEGIEFREALRVLADRAGVELPSYNPEREKQVKSAYEVLEVATKQYEAWLWSDAGRVARDYLFDRGLSEESLKAFRLGFAPEGWDNIGSHLRSLGYREEDMHPTGLLINKTHDTRHTTHDKAFENQDANQVVSRQPSFVSRSYDRFRGRVMFPITDVLGRVVGYSARVLPGGDERQGKYINTPETPVYHKSHILYGIFQAKQSIKRKDAVIVVEGNMDVIAMHQVGFDNTVAVSGTAMTADHIGIIKRYAQNALLFFDADSAGQEAGKKSALACLSGEMSTFLVNIAGGKDASELAQSDAQELRSSVEGAKGAMDYFSEKIFTSYDTTKPEGKKRAVEEMMPFLEAIKNEVERSDWIRKVAERAQVETQAVAVAFERYETRKSPRARRGSQEDRVTFAVSSRLEVLRRSIMGNMLADSSVWKEAEVMLKTQMDSGVSQIFFASVLGQKMLFEGERCGYAFDVFRGALEDDALVREAQSICRAVEKNKQDQSEESSYEVEEVLREFEKEVYREQYKNVLHEMQGARDDPDKSRDLLARLRDISQKIAI